MLLLALILSMALPALAQDDFPPIQTKTSGETGEGYIYISNFSRSRPDDIPEEDWITYSPHLIVLDNDGTLVFRQQLPRRASNFRSLEDGTMIYHAFENPGRSGGAGVDGPYVLLDGAGDELARYTMQGHTTSLHEFLLLENGNHMMFSYEERIMDMSAYEGHPQAIVMNVIIQELDSAGEVVWEWSGWDHFDFDDTVRRAQLTHEPPDPVDFVHPNGLALDLDGNLLLSSKHLDEITKINRETGQIMWRLGGAADPRNEFTFIGDPLNGFSAQHMPVVLENGNLLLFDNGTAHEPRQSRVVEYALNPDARTATLVWAYSNGQYASGMGSVQRLENGNTFIGWGSSQGVAVSEVTPAGQAVFELTLPPSQISYRAYRLPYYGD
jgi:hypothetical protein